MAVTKATSDFNEFNGPIFILYEYRNIVSSRYQLLSIVDI